MKKPQFLDRVPTLALIIVLVVFALAMIPLGYYLGQAGQSATSQRDAAVQQGNQATTKADQGKTLAQQVQIACAAGGSAEQQLQALGACHQATVVQQTQTPVPGPAGQNGTNGSNGANGSNGRGIVSTALVNGDLILSYNQVPLTQDVGHVVGQPGATGSNGRGITDEALIGNDLVLSFSDGTSKDVGPVVGPVGKDGQTGTPGTNGSNGTNGTNGVDGCSIASTAVSSAGDLLITYGAQAACGANASKTVDLGTVQGPTGPPGAQGAKGDQGPPPASYTIEVPNTLGGYTKETCTETSTSPPSDSYTCAPGG